MRLFNAHRPSWLGHAMEPVLNKGLRALPIRRAEAACNSMNHRAYSIFRKPWRFVSVSWRSSALILGNAFWALKLYANKTNSEAP